MRDHSNHIVLTTEEAIATAIARSNFSPSVEVVPATEALDRVLAEDVVSKVIHPSKLSCNMDSVALHWDLIAEGVPADTSGWRRGVEWQFANTGCAMPDGFDTALRIEEVRIGQAEDGSETIEFIGATPKAKGAGTSEPGSRLMPGDLLAPAHAVLTPLLLATIVSGGNTSVPVVSKPKVGFIPTGNELVTCSQEPPAGKTIETNSILLSGMIKQWGGEPLVHPIIPDKYDLIKETILKMCDECDIVVINAGSSKGSDDWTMEILDEIGDVINHETNHAPSKHSAYAVVNDTIVVGISGPAKGAVFTSEFYLKPLICHYLGIEAYPPHVKARLAESFQGGRKPPHKPAPGLEKRVEPDKFYFIQHMRTWIADDGVLECAPVNFGNALEQNAAGAYYALDRQGAEPPKAGDIIEIDLRWPYRLS